MNTAYSGSKKVNYSNSSFYTSLDNTGKYNLDSQAKSLSNTYIQFARIPELDVKTQITPVNSSDINKINLVVKKNNPAINSLEFTSPYYSKYEDNIYTILNVWVIY